MNTYCQSKREDRELDAVRGDFKIALPSADEAFVDGLFGQLVQASQNGEGQLDLNVLRFLVSAIRGLKPTDHLEAIVATQMALVHVAIVKIFPNLVLVQDLSAFIGFDSSFNKLARTFAAQMASLKRYRDLAVPYVKDIDERGEGCRSKVRRRIQKRSNRRPKAADPQNALSSDESKLPEVVSPPSQRGDDDVEQ